MKRVARVRINRSDAAMVRDVIARERILFDWDDNSIEEKARENGLFGEIAAVRHLEKRHPNMLIVPMGLCSRMNVTDGFTSGDILAIERGTDERRSVKTYEVKSTGSQENRIPLVQCDQVERYAEDGVSSLILVNINRECRDVVCDIMMFISPKKIISGWDITKNRRGAECYRHP